MTWAVPWREDTPQRRQSYKFFWIGARVETKWS